MGLRVEQHNIEDLLKYFVARNEFNEFKRKDVFKILEGVTSDKNSQMSISNFAEFYGYYKFLYKLLKQELVEGVVTPTKNSKDLIGRSYYEREFLERYPFEYILDQKLTTDITKEYKFVYGDYTSDLEHNPIWNYVVNPDADIDNIRSSDLQRENTSAYTPDKFGITLIGTPENGDIISVKYTAYDEKLGQEQSAKLKILKGGNFLDANKSKVDKIAFDKKAKEISVFYYSDQDDIDGLFDKIVLGNPENNDDLIEVYTSPMLICSGFKIVNNTEDNKYNLADLFTFDNKVFYTNDHNYKEGFTELTKKTIILAGLRKILDARMVRYGETYLTDVVRNSTLDEIVSFNLDVEQLMTLVLNTNPLTEDDVKDDGYTFKTLESEINNLKAYVNDYVINENVNYDNKYFMKKGVANYAGQSRCTVIPHNTNLYPISTIVNTVNPTNNKDIGDVYVRSDKKNIYVYNTGTNQSEFEFTAIFDNGDYIEFPIEKSFEDFVKICINGIEKVKIDEEHISWIYDEDLKSYWLKLNLDDGNQGTLFNKFDFLIITDDDKKDHYHRVDDKELFVYDENTKVLMVKDPTLVKYSPGNDCYITMMNIADDPILFLLNNLINDPNYYIQKIANFSDRIFVPTEKDYDIYTDILGESRLKELKKNKHVQFADLSDFKIGEDDILFINSLAYTIGDNDYFTLLQYEEPDSEDEEKTIPHRILIIFGLDIDKKDVVYLSRLTESVSPFDFENGISNINDDYFFDRYVYLTKDSSFGRCAFKKDSILEDGHELNEENRYPLDDSTRLYKRSIADRIEYYMTYGEYKATRRQIDDMPDTVKIQKQTRVSVVSHKLGKTPNFVIITPYTDNIKKADDTLVGNITWNADEENIYVYNSGDSTCKFSWYAIYDSKCVVDDGKAYKSSMIIDKDSFLMYNITHETDKSELGYLGTDYLTFNAKSHELSIFNTNINNHSYKCRFSYIVNENSYKNPKFLQYADAYKVDQDGFFDRDPNTAPSGSKVLNYSGEFRASKSKFYGNGIVQYLPVNGEDELEVGDVVSFVNGGCEKINLTNKNNIIGVVAEDGDHAIAIDSYEDVKKVPVAFFGVQYVKVYGEIKSGDGLGLANNLTGIVTNNGTNVENCYLGRALQDYDGSDGSIGLILAIISLKK